GLAAVSPEKGSRGGIGRMARLLPLPKAAGPAMPVGFKHATKMNGDSDKSRGGSVAVVRVMEAAHA
ncbi:MAG: hypothetical protein ACYTAF_15850, partial [Planctomycetota bacterium]